MDRKELLEMFKERTGGKVTTTPKTEPSERQLFGYYRSGMTYHTDRK